MTDDRKSPTVDNVDNQPEENHEQEQDQRPEDVKPEAESPETQANSEEEAVEGTIIDTTEESDEEQQPAADQEDAAAEEAPTGAEEESEQIAALKAEVERNLQGWQRTLAEFQNYKRRVEREQQSAKQEAALDVIKKLLPVIDDFERAMDNLPAEMDGHSWLGGIQMIQDKFVRLMQEYDIEAIDPTGEPFDPNYHQAIAMDDSDEVESGHVIETMQKGYISGDYMLRPALVRVAN